MLVNKALPRDANSGLLPVVEFPTSAQTAIVAATGSHFVTGGKIYRVFADTAGCFLNSMPLEPGLAEYFYAAQDMNLSIGVATGAIVYITEVL